MPVYRDCLFVRLFVRLFVCIESIAKLFRSEFKKHPQQRWGA